MRKQQIIFFFAVILLFRLSAHISILPAIFPSHTSLLQIQEQNMAGVQPTLADFWDGRASFELEIAQTGLPMGESDTLVMANGEWWSYVHASGRSAGVYDRCGDEVSFPGCVVIYKSDDVGQSFSLSENVCQFGCQQCPCDAHKDHTPQQQYPRLQITAEAVWLVYEYLGHNMLRRSADGVHWSRPQRIAYSGLWTRDPRCAPWEIIYPHPFSNFGTEYCLAGGPPGIYIENELVYIFVGMGQNPGSLGCFVGSIRDSAANYRPCTHNPLLTGAKAYGPRTEKGATTRPYWDFRMLSSAEVYKVGQQYYMFYEGLRGPGPNDPGDTQFGLGLARTVNGRIDGQWEPYPHNPILVELPGNIGLGHADMVVYQGETFLFTSLDGEQRSRLKLVWNQ